MLANSPGLHGRSVMVGGVVLTGRQLAEYAEKNGLCKNCAETVVRKKANLWSRWEPVTEKHPYTGEYTVYKGYCIQPTCYTLDQVKKLLGEATDRPTKPRQQVLDAIVSPVHNGGSGRRTNSPSPRQPEPYAAVTNRTTEQNSQAAWSNGPPMPTITHHDPRSQSERPHPHTRFVEQPRHDNAQSERFHANGTNRLERRISDTSEEVSEEASYIENLRKFADKPDFVNFMVEMDLHHFKKNVARDGFKILQDAVIKIHKTKRDAYLFPSDAWVKTIKTALVSKTADEETVTQGLLVFMSFSGVSPAYRRDVLQYPTVDAILTVREKFRSNLEIEDLCCACLEVLFADNQDREWKLKAADTEKTIETLIMIMNNRNRSDKCGFALRALFNLSLQEHFAVNGVSVSERVNEALTANNGVNMMLTTLEVEDLSDMVTEAALYLLWRMSLPTANADGVSFQAGSGILPTENIVRIILNTMKMHESSPLTQEAGCGILCNLMLPSSNFHYPLFLAKPTLEAISNGLSRHRDLSSNHDVKTLQMVHLNGILAIHNLLCNTKLRSAVGSDGDVLSSSIVKSMSLFKEKPVIQAVGCMALSRVCGMGLQQKQEVIAASGIGAVADAFRKHVKSASAEEKNARSIFDGACTIAASLSILPDARTELIRSDLIDNIQEVFLRDPSIASDPSAQFVLTTAMSMTNSSKPEVLLSNIIEKSSNVEVAESCFSALASGALHSDDYLNKLLVCHDGNGIGCLIDLMERFAHSAAIQQEGIAILALVYSKFPFTGALGKVNRIGVVNILCHTEHEVEVIQNAMRLHRTHAGVQENGFAALTNFIAPICGEGNNFGPTASLFASSFKDIQEAIVLNDNAPAVYKGAILFFWTLTFICREDDLQVWGLRIMQRLFDCIRRYPSDEEMELIVCDALIGLLEDERRLEFASSPEQFETIMKIVHSSNEAVVARACQIVATLLSNYFPASNQIVEIENAVEQLLFCMDTYIASEEIQQHLCSIMKSLVTLQDHFVKHMIAGCGGLKSLMDSAMKHRQNQALVEDAVLAMTGVARALSLDIISPMQSQLGKFITRVIEENMDNPDLEAAVLGLLWVLCGHDEYFKRLVSESNTVPQIIDVMNQHLMSAELQKAGCSILWVLSSFGQSKLFIGRNGGIRSIVNAMNAHTDNTALQKEALTALKNLATAHENSRPLIQNGAEDAVIRVLWINMKFPQVLAAGFSALNNIAVDSRNRSVARMQDVTMMLILQAMRRFPTNEHVQKNAVFLLKSYSYSEDNMQLMASHADELVLLLAVAAQNFPVDCNERAVYLMNKIEQTAVEARNGRRR